MNTEPSSSTSESRYGASRLLFIHNADFGLMAALFDSTHKLLSPSTYDCQICALTHGLARPREQWNAFLKTLDMPMEFLHRDEFRRRFPQLTGSTALPANFRERDGALTPLLGGTALPGKTGLDAPRAGAGCHPRSRDQNDVELHEPPGAHADRSVIRDRRLDEAGMNK